MIYFRRRWLTLLIFLAAIIAIIFLTASQPRARSFFASRDEPNGSCLDFIAEIYEKVAPSVVGVEGLWDDGQGKLTMGTGSGLIISEEGYIITNYHVVAEAIDIKVTLSDDRSGAALLIAGDESLDLALLKTELTHIRAATLGASDRLRVGDVVFSIGDPGGEQFARSMTMGLISGMDRQLSVGEASMGSLLQTDAAINPGNSGGPLVDCDGVVIGINSAKIVDADFEGMGFAIPADTVRAFLETALPAFFMSE